MKEAKHSQNLFLFIIRILTVLLLALFLINYIRVAIPRIKYPFELEWNEGDIAVASIRVSEGKPIYPPPEEGYVPYFYPPLFPMICGMLFKLFGASLSIGRILSFVASLGLAVVLGITVYQWTRNTFAGIFSGLFYISCYKVSGFWTDLMRIDSFAWFLSFACVMLIFTKDKPSPLRLVIAAIAGVGAALCKQNAALPIIPAALFLFIYHHKRSRFYFFMVAALIAINFFWFYTHGANSWFFKYYYQIPSKHHVFWNFLTERLPGQLYGYITLPLIFVGVWFVISLPFFKKQNPLTTLWFLLISAAATVGGILAYLKIGGFVNNFIPLLAALALLMGMAVHFFWTFLPSKRFFFVPRLIVHLGILILLVAILPRYTFHDREVFPHPGSTERGYELINIIHDLPGKVYVPHHNYYAYWAGKGMFYSVDAVRDLNWAGVATPEKLKNALKKAEYDWLVLDIDINYEWIPGDALSLIKRNYVSKGRVIQYRHFLEVQPITGCTMKPRFLWKARTSNVSR